MKGSVLADAFAGCVPVAGALLPVAGATVLDGVVGVFVDFDGEVPLLGPVPVLGVVAGVVGGGGGVV